MKKKVLLILSIIAIISIFNQYNVLATVPENMKVQMEAIVVCVNKKNILVMEKGNEFSNVYKTKLYYASMEKDIGYKVGQEVRIYCSGEARDTTIKAKYIIYRPNIEEINVLENVGKIEIIKDKTDNKEVKEYINYYNSSEKVLNKNKIQIIIITLVLIITLLIILVSRKKKISAVSVLIIVTIIYCIIYSVGYMIYYDYISKNTEQENNLYELNKINERLDKNNLYK